MNNLKVLDVTLHVGLGTFRPVEEENVLEHKMHEEFYMLDKEVANELKLPQSTLRFWEKEIPLLNPNKSAGGTRRYIQKDIDLLRQIKFLIEDQHLTLAGVNERLANHRNVDEKRLKVIQTLKSVRI